MHKKKRLTRAAITNLWLKKLTGRKNPNNQDQLLSIAYNQLYLGKKPARPVGEPYG